VGPKGARDFYFKKGWRDLDDIVEYGWDGLSRVQQIGVKYYDEFLDKIPRDEVEMIGQVILDAANRVAEGCQMVIVGGHRRGKKESGDVDVVVSNPDEEKTLYLITGIVAELEKEGWITHTLLLSTANSERNQTPVSYKGENGPHGTGFDTLDKALVVWQDPRWEGKEDALAENPKAKNPNVHRRVDIIISSWKTVGCAVAGWTSGTTFQRDLRRYAKAALNLKFDSSGIRSRDDGAWVDFEDGGKGKAPDMLTAEKRVFEGLKLEWREPWERCTG
jgi:DNA polymerase/3'-5' exonuclease PolX